MRVAPGARWRVEWKISTRRRWGTALMASSAAGKGPKDAWKMQADSASGSLSELTGEGAKSRSAHRIAHLKSLLELNKTYKACLHADYLLGQPEPVYKNMRQMYESSLKALDENREDEEQLLKSSAVDMIVDMQLTAEQLKIRLKSWNPKMLSSFGERDAKSAEGTIRGKVGEYIELLYKRIAREIPALPFSSSYVYRAVAQARKSARSSSPLNENGSLPGPMEQFGRVEKAAEKFVTKKIEQVRDLPAEEIFTAFKEAAEYSKGVWDRLNGAGLTAVGSAQMPLELPVPLPTKEESMNVMGHLSLVLESLEKQLQEASKNRETKLRSAGLQERTQLAFQLRMMDDQVLQLTRMLAVKSLQLQMEYIYTSLEAEALDYVEDDKVSGRPGGQGSTEELSLLMVEFCLLDEKLAQLVETLAKDPSAPVRDDTLQGLVEDVADLCGLLGISADAVFEGSRVSWHKCVLQLKASAAKVEEGVQFFARGARLLTSDLANGGLLFSRAALGSTLKPREVAELRRTARDILTLVPFGLILITPLSPMGHVLVFGFLQRYFPGIFPSQFTSRRQDLITRYDTLREQLEAAQEEAALEEDEAELARAAAAVARLTAPATDDVEEPSLSNIAEKLKKLQQQVRAAALDTVSASEEEF
eukprot:evm.model.scf_916.3 EVM.evm.TU.scf_916.3   scf_916:39388-45212(+)